MDNLLSSKIQANPWTTKRVIAVISMLGLVGVIAAIAISSNSSVSSVFLKQIELEESEFQDFLQTYHKSYQGEEYLKRLNIFRDNAAFIRVHNLQNQDWVLGINQFADITFQEFKEKYLTSKFPEIKPQEIKEIENPVQGTPATVDWRTKGAVTPVLDQGVCLGGSYAFAAIGAIEGIWNITGNPLVPLSVQEIIDCSGTYGNHGCDFGNVLGVYEYVTDKGVTSDAVYPFTAKTGTCNGGDVTKIVAEIQGYSEMTNTTSAALMTTVAQQPVTVGVQADQATWVFYHGGIITNNCGTKPDHNVLIVGYNSVKKPNYWIVKNSWGKDWGESGYMRIAMKDGAGVCGINLYTSFPEADN
ncbi:unnamed protein product [Blepharisma stoltei]|uniref:Uncharacterized protein n=1 Tax=Blepharisma stoltei TaxID=1481888 RepID=A0AAU9I7D3_9CILI|nr:unnamed protein product [Blepharisma stoltei]